MSADSTPDPSLLRIERDEPKSRPRRRRGGGGRWFGRIVLLAILVGVGYFFWPRIRPYLESARAPEVRTGAVIVTRPGQDLELTTASGYVVARTRAALATRLIGRLIAINVEEGSEVSKGDVLAKIEPKTWEFEVARLQASKEQAQARVASSTTQVHVAKAVLGGTAGELKEASAALRESDARLAEANRVLALERRLAERGSGTADALKKAQNDVTRLQAACDRSRANVAILESRKESRAAEVKSAEAQVVVAEKAIAEVQARLDSALRDLEDTEIRAPFDGVVLAKEAEVGEMVVPALAGGGTSRGAVVTMAAFDSLEIEVDVFERDIGLVVEGGEAEVVIDAYTKERLPGRIRRIVPSADRGKGTVLVKVGFDRKGLRVLPDMRGRVTFLRERPDVPREAEVLVPSGAVVERAGQTGVYLLDGDRVRFRAVVLGESRGAFRVVTSGLRGNETVILSPPPELKNEALVRIAPE